MVFLGSWVSRASWSTSNAFPASIPAGLKIDIHPLYHDDPMNVGYRNASICSMIRKYFKFWKLLYWLLDSQISHFFNHLFSCSNFFINMINQSTIFSERLIVYAVSMWPHVWHCLCRFISSIIKNKESIEGEEFIAFFYVVAFHFPLPHINTNIMISHPIARDYYTILVTYAFVLI